MLAWCVVMQRSCGLRARCVFYAVWCIKSYLFETIFYIMMIVTYQ